MPLQNRVTPFGEIVATADRGMLMGNRGCLHDANRTLGTRRWASKAWLSCSLSFEGRRRQIMCPGRYTELFFLDEPTALAAGHRPCWECRRDAYRAFIAHWSLAAGRRGPVTADEMDKQLHSERVDRRRKKVTFRASLPQLPDGAMIAVEGVASLKWNGTVRRWSSTGYGPPSEISGGDDVEVLTPASIVGALRAGYAPLAHPSVDAR